MIRTASAEEIKREKMIELEKDLHSQSAESLDKLKPDYSDNEFFTMKRSSKRRATIDSKIQKVRG